MFEVLPLNSVREEDKQVVGLNLFNLARLKHLDFPVPQGIIVTPPDIKLKTILEHFNIKKDIRISQIEKEVFEQRLELVKSEVAKIAVPEELKSKLSARNIDSRKIWLSLLDIWIGEIRSRIWREGFYQGITSNLSSQAVFFTSKITASGSAYYHYPQNKVVIKESSVTLDEKQIEKLEELIKSANKKLVIPQIYSFIIDVDLKLVKLSPFTQYPELSFVSPQEKPVVLTKDYETALKVFLNLDESLNLEKGIDGVIINSDKFLDNEKKLWHLVETSSFFRDIPVIYKLPDHIEKFGGLRGALRLIRDSKLLKQEVENVLFARNKKQLLNVHIAVPHVRSVDEFLQIKRDLASMGLNRKGTFKLWLEISTPENLINIEEYLIAGFDGALLNLDELACWVNGYDGNTAEAVFYKKQIKAVTKLLEEGSKILHKAKIPVVATGKLVSNDDLLMFLIDKGIFGIAVDKTTAYTTREYLHFIEQRRFHLHLN